MSIYGTHWTIQVEHPDSRWPWVEVTAQGVPAFIGHPNGGYETDPYASFLPPLGECDENTNGPLRAMVFVLPETQKGTERSGQEYIDPLLVLPGPEYEAMSADDLIWRLREEIEKREKAGAPTPAR